MNVTVTSDFPDKTVCVLGMGYVGVTLATSLASVGFRVHGIEIRPDVVARLSSGDAHFYEPGLSDLLSGVVSNGRLTVHPAIPKECKPTVFIITVGTPLDASGEVSLDSITNATREVAVHLKDGDMVLLRSTVKLGTTRNLVQPILSSTGKKFQLAYCPERTVEGQAMAELRYLPQIVGADTPSCSLRAAQLFQFITPTIVRVSDFEAAEMIKLVDNTKRDVMFAYANEIARLCDAIGISAEEVISSGRFGYSRTDLPLPGPVGGPCLSKDPYILEQSVRPYGVIPEITLAARRTNERQMEETADFLSSVSSSLSGFSTQPQITLLGIAFKGHPPTDDIRGTMAISLLKHLRRAFPAAFVAGWDPVVGLDAISSLGIAAKTSLVEAISDSSIAVILTHHSEFERMPIATLAQKMARPGIIYDFWNLFNRVGMDLPAGVRYIALGSHKKPICGKG
jgi:nucleotide sugar dehydrogenase